MKKYEIVYQKYRNDIISGYLKKNDPLPSIRESVALFKVSKTSVEHAYSLLMMEGYINSKEKKGYYVCIDKERILLHQNFDSRIYKKQTNPIRYDFRSHTILPNTFDLNIWKKYMREAFSNSLFLSTYGETQGEYDLREALCQYAYQERNVLCTPNDIIVSSNFQSLLFLLCGFFPKNIIIGMEEHSFAQAEQVFRSYGFSCIKIKSNEEGIDIEDLKKYDLDVLYINSADSGLLKKALSFNHKEMLLSYTQEKNILIIEDDHNGELNYTSSSTYAMQGYAHDDNVIYCGSFSRLLPPSIRISYMVLNKKYLSLYKQSMKNYSPMTSKIEQQALARYIRDGHLKKQLRKLKKEYRIKYNFMNSLLSSTFSNYYLEEAALRFHIPLPNNINIHSIINDCIKHKIAIELYNNHEICISFAGILKEDMQDAILLLSKIINSQKV